MVSCTAGRFLSKRSASSLGLSVDAYVRQIRTGVEQPGATELMAMVECKRLHIEVYLRSASLRLRCVAAFKCVGESRDTLRLLYDRDDTHYGTLLEHAGIGCLPSSHRVFFCLASTSLTTRAPNQAPRRLPFGLFRFPQLLVVVFLPRREASAVEDRRSRIVPPQLHLPVSAWLRRACEFTHRRTRLLW